MNGNGIKNKCVKILIILLIIIWSVFYTTVILI